jgi:hypothetical protein
MTQAQKITLIAEVLKKRFPNLTVTETIDIAFKILEAVDA